MRKLNIYSTILIFMIVAIIAFMFPLLSSAVPAAPGVHTLSQPDGSTFEAKQWGDESHRGWETTDGYTIEFNEGLNNWTYLAIDKNGERTNSQKIVGKDLPHVDLLNFRTRLSESIYVFFNKKWRYFAMQVATLPRKLAVVP